MIAVAVDSLEPLNLRTTPAIIADLLREQIARGSLKPGARIADVQVAQKLGVSRGPVREALQRLVQEGLLVNVTNRGVCVVKLNADDVVDIFWARRAIETQAFVHLARNRSEQVIAKLTAVVDSLEACIDSGDHPRIVECDLEFHATVVEATGSARLKRMFNTLLAETRLCLFNLVSVDYSRSNLVQEHRELIRLICAGTEKELVEAIHRHLDTGVSDLLEHTSD